MRPRRVDALCKGRAAGIQEGALVHVHAGEAVALEARLTGAEVLSDGVCAEGPRVAGTWGGTLVDVLASVAVRRESSLAGASVGPDGVETGGVDMARVVFTLVHVNAVHALGRAVVANTAGAAEGAVRVGALLVRPAGVVHFHALVYVLTQSLVEQREPRLAQAGEGTLAVHARGSVSAASVVNETLIYVAALRCSISRISNLAGALVGAGEVDAQGLGVALLGERALVHIPAGQTISLEPRCALTGEGAGRICADCVGAATSCRALVRVVALGVVKDKAKPTVAVEGASGVDAGGGRRADAGRCTLVDVLALSPVSRETPQTGALVASQPVDANGIGVALIVSTALVYVCAGQAVPSEAGVAGALVGAHGVGAVCVQTAEVAGTFVDVHAALAIALEAAAARAAVAAGQIPTTLVTKCGGAHPRSLRALVYVEAKVVSIAFVAGVAGADVGAGVVDAGGVPVADSSVGAFVHVGAPEAVTTEAEIALAPSAALGVGADGVCVATPVFFLALIDVQAVGAVSHVSVRADAAVAAQGVVAASLRVAAVELALAFVDVAAQQTVALVAHATCTSEVVLNLQAFSVSMALAARCLTLPWVSH